MQPTTETTTDIEMLCEAFGSEYFIFSRIKNKITLNPGQKLELYKLIDDRNHFEILHLVTSLRTS